MFRLEKKCSGGRYLETVQQETPCVGVAHCTLLISEHQASSGVWLKLAPSLLSYMYWYR